MAEEIKKVITIEVGKSITSIRDFRKHIEDLRGSLLVLNQDSEEYKTIAAEIAQNQAKLNEVMKVGKTDTDAAAGSYVELNNQLKALRNQYKALSESDREGAVGKNMLVNIQQLDEKLKDLDEGMGVYNRNVGNYKQAFEEAFKAMAQNIGNVNPQLGKLMQTAAQLIPLIKAASKAATDGLKGVKAGIASTGIGLLVVALGEILANWEAISGWIQRVLGKQKELTDETKNTANAASSVADNLKSVIEYQNALAAARGVDPLQIASGNLTEFNAQVNHLSESEERIKHFYDAVEAAQRKNISDLPIKIYGANAIGGYVIEAEEDAKQLYNTLLDTEKGLFTHIQNVSRLIELRNGLTTRSSKELDRTLENLKTFLDGELKIVDDNYTKARNNQDEANKEYTKQLVAFQTGLKNRFKSELELRKDKYEREKQLVIENISNEKERNAALLNLQKEYERDVAKIRNDAWKSSSGYAQLQEDLQNIKAIQERLKNQGKDEMEILQETYEAEKALLIKYNQDTTKLDEEYWLNKLNIIHQNARDVEEAINGIVEEIKNTWREAYQEELNTQELFEAQAISAVSTKMVNGRTTTGDSSSDIAAERQKEDEIFMIQKAGYEARIQSHQDYLMLLEEGDSEYLDVQRQIAEEEMGLAELVYNHTATIEERKREDIQETLRIIQGSIQFYGGIANEIASYTLETAKEGTAEYKAAQITQTIVSTLSGMVGSFSQAMSLYGPTPWGFALGAAGATAMGIIGALRVNQIKNANANSSITSSSTPSSSMGASVSPLLNPDYDLQRITNLSLQSDDYLPGKTQVYVLESDIQEVGNRVQVRENNATF